MSESAIRPDADVRDEFLASDDGGPFVMVNFLRFKSGGGSKAYGKYGEAFGKLVVQYGGKFVYNGRVAQKFVGDEEWHAVALVHYPTRKAFIDCTSSPEYLEIHPHREDGLEKTQVYATIPVSMA